MTNYEYYKESITAFLLEHGHTSFAFKNGEITVCKGIGCMDCEFCGAVFNCQDIRKEWLNEEHNPYTIPLDTPVDTKVLVSNDGVNWKKRYFSHFDILDNRFPYACFSAGGTSWSSDLHCHYRYCKLWEGNENDKI